MAGIPPPAWLITTACPAMTMAPLRGDPVAFAGTVYPTAPLPVPEVPDTMVMKLDDVPSSPEVHAQLCIVMIWIMPLMVPVAGTLWVPLPWML
jgi:hypothetical protein